MTFPFATLAFAQPLRVDSSPARATAVMGYTWPASKRPLTVGLKPVAALPAFMPSVTLPTRPGKMLGRLGAVTTPMGGAPAFRMARRWAWVRYCWAFGDPAAGSPLRLSDGAADLSHHHRQTLSEDLGVGVALEAATRYLRLGQPAGTKVQPIDIENAITFGSVAGQTVTGTAGTKMRPDYLLIRRVPGDPQQIFALECKGTHADPIPLGTLYKAAAQVQGIQIGPLPGVPGASAAPNGFIGAVGFSDQEIYVELLDPPGDERWTGNPTPRTQRSSDREILHVQADGAVQVDDPDRFGRLLADVVEAQLLTLAGRSQQAAERLAQWPGERQSNSAGSPERYADEEFGEFDGALLRMSLGGGDDVEVFMGVRRQIADAIEADDESRIEASEDEWHAALTAGSGTDGDDDDYDVRLEDQALTVAFDDGVLLHARHPRSARGSLVARAKM